ncbi:3-phosphoserine/phosphohydroxythreonine transaminase [Lactococcus nasutitermitis]|uniref:Phosphoserine aminotransferase n=1 Tax=Lactococcus nasutitermitis TaxID=1652957 RepID=A0ABV9JDU0_9LACT|nr:3-phosphoserine/phosphohydroxythreonine transaminase [Lactococcus nasutitermitis]
MTIYNFAAGPSVLPKEVLKKAQVELLDIAGSGMSVMELTHRGKEFSAIIAHAEETLRELMAIPENYKVLFLQGGASTQFSMVPLNLGLGKKAYYAISGSFGKKAFDEAVKLSKSLDIEPISLGTTEKTHFDRLVTFDSSVKNSDAAYVHITLNNTIEGTTIYELPDTGNVPLVGDMSSDILAVDYDVSKFGLIYAGAQKNIGPAGLTVVIIREDLLPTEPVLSSMLDYRILAKNDSLYNTPPTFAIYMAGLVFDWVKAQGGVNAMEKRNREKASLLYDYLDSTDFYQSPVRYKNERSICNVVFRTENVELDAEFCKEAEAQGFKNIKGHRSVGGMRASIYNAFPREGIVELIDFMKKFEREHQR